MKNKENMETANNSENKAPDVQNFELPENLKTILRQATETYRIIRSELIKVDKEWLTVQGRHSLIIDFKLDMMYLIGFLAVMSGSPDEYPIYIAEQLFEGEPENNNALGFIRVAENLGIKHLIDNYKVTAEDTKKFDQFTSNTTNILKILPSFGDYYELSMIYYLYSALIASICKLMEVNAYSPVIYTGINNYLNTQFTVCEEHMSKRELDEFEKNVFPFLKRVNAKMKELEQAVKD
ncbi:MAG: hypothetical protein K6B38_00470 [Ruminococcus sp.]|nr:hypothetical protein [Ruminococcus sp.]